MKTIKGFVKKYWITVLIFAGLVLLYYYVADVKMNVGKYMNVGDAYKYACFFQITHPISISFFSDCSYIWYNHGIK